LRENSEPASFPCFINKLLMMGKDLKSSRAYYWYFRCLTFIKEDYAIRWKSFLQIQKSERAHNTQGFRKLEEAFKSWYQLSTTLAKLSKIWDWPTFRRTLWTCLSTTAAIWTYLCISNPNSDSVSS